MMTDKKTGEPYINIWFGNFYRPAYDDKDFVIECIWFLKKNGFNSVMLDTKDWEDFRERLEGKEASQYVSMQEYMQQELCEQGMSHEFLALYLNGDNLYPNIRFSPPVYGDSVTDQYGNDGKWYRYWSDRARDAMQEHAAGIMKAYGKNYVTVLLDGKERRPVCSMWDPIAAPSFDEEGKRRYRDWLFREYKGSIRLFNESYGTQKKSFYDLEKEDYWFACRYPDSASFSQEDVQEKSPKARMLMDNRKWQCEELCLYFEDMEKRLHQTDESLYLCPDMAQWGYFLNPDGAMLAGVGLADLWDTAARGIDIYRLAEYTDCAHFISVPVTPDGDADAYVTSCHHSMMRSMNRGREFIGGIFWGRFLYHDIYTVLTPCEVAASIAASGASGYTSYGMCGLDDGGVLHRMEEHFHESLSRANAWLKRVLAQLGKKKQADIAILFPSAMAAYENMRTEGNKERRLDLLGWYRACRDLGLEADVTDSRSLCRGHFSDHRVLIVPDNDCYEMNPEPEFEAALREWCEGGGILLTGPYCALVENSFGIEACGHCPDAVFYQEAFMVKSGRYVSYPEHPESSVCFGGTCTAWYLGDKAPCITRYQTGKGCMYAFGFSYGAAYCAKTVPHVPKEQKNNELYPLELMKENILADLLKAEAGIETKQEKMIEKAYFQNGEIIINHTSYPYEVSARGMKLYQYQVSESLLLPHSAVFIKY